jgi:hypothetical protein
MKNYIFFVLSLSSTFIFSQKIENYTHGLRKLTTEDWNTINQTPQLQLTENQKRAVLPAKLDNTERFPYFPGIFNQTGGSCAQSSGVHYNFTYAINAARNRSVDGNSKNIYPSHYTYNFLNRGDDKNGSWYFDGWNIIDANGCPNENNYSNSFACDGKFWMTGYDNYYQGMKNKILDVFTIKIQNEAGLNTLKNWLYNGIDGKTIGGIANFSAGVYDYIYRLKSVNPIIHQFDTVSNHALTIVGYDDEIKYDYNKDGKFTNNIDLNNDQVIDVRDWEIGAVKIANSWGTYWGLNGFAYVMYKVLAEKLEQGGIWNNMIHVIKAKDSYSPKITGKVSIDHSSREKLKISFGVTTDLNKQTPDHMIDFPIFNYQGGDFNLNGNNLKDQVIELGFDLTGLLSYINPNQPAKFFLIVNEKDSNNNASGKIHRFSMLDYTDSINPIEKIANISNIEINNNTTTYVPLLDQFKFNKPEIIQDEISFYNLKQQNTFQLTSINNAPPTKWVLNSTYNCKDTTLSIPSGELNLISKYEDDEIIPFKLPFQFKFYNKLYDSIFISTDGNIHFENEFKYIRNPNAIKKSKVIAIHGEDLVYKIENNDYIKTKVDQESVVIEWKASLFDSSMNAVHFATKITKEGQIFMYFDKILPTSFACGLSNGDNFQYFTTDETLNKSNRTICFNPKTICPFNVDLSSDGVLKFQPENDINQDVYIDLATVDFNKIKTLKTIKIKRNTSLSLQEHLDYQLETEVYPTPFHAKLIITQDQKRNNPIHQIEIISLEGKSCYQLINTSATDENIEIDLSFLQKGSYIIKLHSDHQLITKKIIKE